jgi:hypothetical protein
MFYYIMRMYSLRFSSPGGTVPSSEFQLNAARELKSRWRSRTEGRPLSLPSTPFHYLIRLSPAAFSCSLLSSALPLSPLVAHYPPFCTNLPWLLPPPLVPRAARQLRPATRTALRPSTVPTFFSTLTTR